MVLVIQDDALVECVRCSRSLLWGPLREPEQSMQHLLAPRSQGCLHCHWTLEKQLNQSLTRAGISYTAAAGQEAE